MASTPMSQRLPCAARPVIVTSSHTKPRCAGMIASFVGSATMAPSARTPLREQRARADAVVLLVGHGGDDDLAANRRLRGAPGAGAHRRDAALHVRRAAAVQPAVALFGVERSVNHSLDADDVEMSVEHQRASATRRPDARHEIRTADGRVLQLGDESPIVQHVAQEIRAFPLAGRTTRERRIARVDLHECARERARITGGNRRHLWWSYSWRSCPSSSASTSKPVVSMS